MLISFTAYLHSPAMCPGRPDHVPFQDWMTSRLELHRQAYCKSMLLCFALTPTV